MQRDVKSGEEVRSKIKAGIDKVADTVKVTLGVRGRNVILDTNPYTSPVNTNDGVTIAREFILADRFENIGAKLIREVAAKTNDVAGDGTTTASLLMQAIIAEGIKAIGNGADAVYIRRGVQRASQAIVEYLKKESVKADSLDMLISTARISCGDDALGEMVAKAVQEGGVDGVVTLEDNAETSTVITQIEGLKLRGGFTVPNYINSAELQQAILNKVAVFVTNQNITLAQEMAQIMEATHASGKKEVVVIANSIDSDALMTSLKNWLENRFFALPIRVMAYGDMGEGMLRDVAAITGAKFFDGAANDRVIEVTKDDLGFAEKVVATRSDTTIITSDEERKAERIKTLKAQVKATDKEFEKEGINERIAKLNNSVFTIKVGGITDSERTERKLRVEDAINATRAAMNDGVIVGGGSALYRASMKVGVEGTGDELLGFELVLRACQAPIKQMALNSSITLDRSDFEKIESHSKATIDFISGQIVDGYTAGIIDPIKVVTSSLENAASAAGLFLITEAAVVLERDLAAEEKL